MLHDRKLQRYFIRHYFFFSFPPQVLSFFCNLYLYDFVCVCVYENLTDLTQSLSSIETQWSHLISHASDVLMNQHTLAHQQ